MRNLEDLDNPDAPEPPSKSQRKRDMHALQGDILAFIFREKMQLMTGGNPFFLVECVRMLKNSGMALDAFSEEGRCPVPESIEALLQDKLKSMTPLVHKVLRSAAVLGNWFTPDVLELIVREDTDEFLSALEELTRSNLIEVDLTRKPAGGYHFKHDIERRIILDQVGPARRRN